MRDRLVWIDCEMTGLDLGKDALIEVAALVTDPELNVLGDGVDVVIHADEAALDGMPEIVRDDARQVRPDRGGPRARRSPWPRPRTWSWSTSRSFVKDPRTRPAVRQLDRHRPGLHRPGHARLDAHLHYRMIDVSSIKELCRRWYPRVYFGQPAKGLAHRALADIRESIRELEYYRRTVFVPLPGPDVETAKAIAAEL